MKNSPPHVSFLGRLEKFNDSLWSFHIKIPGIILSNLKKDEIDRMICYLDGIGPIHASPMPAGNGIYFIKLNKEWVSKGGWSIGKDIQVEIWKDESEYGLPMPEELEITLAQDDEGYELFHSLTRGKQRNLIYMIGKLKSQELRINRSTIILDHLKEEKGVLDFRRLNELFKLRRLE
jgi:hypothetical protein